MSYDVAAVRAQFPALKAGTAHFDGPGGSQVPEPVARAVADTLTSPIANRGRITACDIDVKRLETVTTLCHRLKLKGVETVVIPESGDPPAGACARAPQRPPLSAHRPRVPCGLEAALLPPGPVRAGPGA